MTSFTNLKQQSIMQKFILQLVEQKMNKWTCKIINKDRNRTPIVLD